MLCFNPFGERCGLSVLSGIRLGTEQTLVVEPGEPSMDGALVLTPTAPAWMLRQPAQFAFSAGCCKLLVGTGEGGVGVALGRVERGGEQGRCGMEWRGL